MKKAQTTIYFIVGIVLIIIVGLLVYNSNNEKVIFEEAFDAGSFESFVEECIRSISLDTIREEGYIVDTVKSSLEENIEDCIKIYPLQGEEMELIDPKVFDLFETEESLQINLNYHIIITKDSFRHEFENFKTDLLILQSLDIEENLEEGIIQDDIKKPIENLGYLYIQKGTKIYGLSEGEGIDVKLKPSLNDFQKGVTIEFMQSDVYFGKPVELSIQYDEANENGLVPLRYDSRDEEWLAVPFEKDEANNEILVDLYYLSDISLVENDCSSVPDTCTHVVGYYGDYIIKKLVYGENLYSIWEDCASPDVEFDEFKNIVTVKRNGQLIFDLNILFEGDSMYIPSDKVCVNHILNYDDITILDGSSTELTYEEFVEEFDVQGEETHIGRVDLVNSVDIYNAPENIFAIFINDGKSGLSERRTTKGWQYVIRYNEDSYFSDDESRYSDYKIIFIKADPSKKFSPDFSSEIDYSYYGFENSDIEIPHIFSPNFLPNPNCERDPETGRCLKSTIVLHYTEGRKDQMPMNFFEPGGLSAHYVILGNGAVYNLVDEDAMAQHAGPIYNPISIGIEIANLGKFHSSRGKYFTTSCEEEFSYLTNDLGIPPESINEIYSYDGANSYGIDFDGGPYFGGYKCWADFPEGQIDALTELIEDIKNRRPEISQVIGHVDIADKYDPGPKIMGLIREE